jgi:hypothetical protein
MDNQDTLATFGTHDTGRRQTTPKKESVILFSYQFRSTMSGDDKMRCGS